jgi:peptide/nickel transport system permease protein
MGDGTTFNGVALRRCEVPHTVSPGLWALAWKRLKSDRVGMVSLAIVVLFVAMMVASGVGLVARDWAKEIGVNYAPPSLLGADGTDDTPTAPATRQRRQSPKSPPSNTRRAS